MLIFIIQLKSKYTSFSRTQFLRSVSRFLKILVFTFTVSLGLLFHSRPIAFIQEEICILFLYKQGGFPGGSDGKEPACNAGDLSLISVSEDPLQKGMATHSSILWEDSMESGALHGITKSDTTRQLTLLLSFT